MFGALVREQHPAGIGEPRNFFSVVGHVAPPGFGRCHECERPSDLEVSGHSLRVGAAQDLLIRGYDLAAIMRAGGWSNPSTVSRYLKFSQHNIWKS